jgi:predicted component of type VI protein secretion system
MNLSILLLDGEKLNFKSNKTSLTLGRSAQCDVVIPYEAMSRQHCLIELKDGDIFVTDLASSNGVLVEGQKIPANIPFLYQSYFSLTFGAVQSIAISHDDPASEQRKGGPSLSAIQIKRPENNRASNDRNNPKKVISAAAKNSPQNNFVKIATFLAILGLIGYFLTQDDGPTEATPQQIYE